MPAGSGRGELGHLFHVWNREVRGETPGVPRNRMLCNALLRPRSDAHMGRRHISQMFPSGETAIAHSVAVG